MDKKKQKLELTWIGKDKRPRLEPRVLVEDVAKSHHAATRRRDGKDIFDNMLIHGDNLLALKALEQQFVGQVKCIYIDPPYNTGNAFEHYDDGVEHSIWLGLMRERLELLCKLLSKDGSIWITLDDAEVHYCKVICDEIFGRENFHVNIVWQHSIQPKGYIDKFSIHHNHILLYSKSDLFKINPLPREEKDNKAYSNPDNDPKGPWRSGDVRNALYRPNLIYDVITPSGKVIKPCKNGWRWSKETMEAKIKTGEIIFSKDETRIIRKIYLANVGGRAPESIFFGDQVGTTRESMGEIKGIFGADTFATPKPERLIQRVLQIATKPGDLVLDSFLGSGTTAAVAHKMGRRWIGVELGDHCYTHCKVRLDKVINGEDAGGITKAVGWKGGGGYRFYELAPTLITKDQWGQEVINRDYNPAMLAEAVCKLEGFTYAPSESEYFIHGHSTERDYIYVTTNYLKAEHLRALSELVGPERTLLVCCKGFSSGVKFPNLTVKKIPKAVLDKCEYGHDDYSLNVKNLPMSAPELTQGELFD